MITGKKVLVTGGTGYLGKYIVDVLKKESYDVAIATRKENYSKQEDNQIRTIIWDITANSKPSEKFDYIVHCAGRIEGEYSELYAANVVGTENVLEFSLISEAKLIHISSAGVVGKCKELHIDESISGEGHNNYEKTKRLAEDKVNDYIKKGLDVYILRPTIIFGLGREPEKDSFLQLLRTMKSGRYMNIGQGIYNLIHTDEVASAVLFLLKNDLPEKIFLINDPLSFEKLSLIVNEALGKQGKTIHISPTIGYLIGALTAVLFGIRGRKNPLTSSRVKALSNRQIFLATRLFEAGYNIEKATEERVKGVIGDYQESGLL